MPKVIGKLPTKETSELELTEEKITISIQRGLIGKKMIPYKDIPLNKVVRVWLEKGHEPFKDYHHMRIEYTTKDGEDELSFFTTNESQINEIYSLISENITKREELLRKQRKDFKDTRELQLNIAYQNLELVDYLFDFTSHLGGKIDWHYLHETLKRMKQIQNEMETLDSSHYRFNLDELESLLKQRQIKNMKSEIKTFLEIILQGVTEASSHKVDHFNSRYHHLLVTTLFLLRNRDLSELTDNVDETDESRLNQQVEALIALVGSERLEIMNYSTESFDRARLYSMVDFLMGVPFRLIL